METMLDRVIPLSCVPPYATPYSHVFTTPISNNTNTVFYEDTADSDWQSSDYDSEHATVNVPIRSKRKKNAAKEGNPVDPISEDPHQESFSDGSEAAGPSAPRPTDTSTPRPMASTRRKIFLEPARCFQDLRRYPT